MAEWYHAKGSASMFNLETETPEGYWRQRGTFTTLAEAQDYADRLYTGQRCRILPTPAEVWRNWY